MLTTSYGASRATLSSAPSHGSLRSTCSCSRTNWPDPSRICTAVRRGAPRGARSAALSSARGGSHHEWPSRRSQSSSGALPSGQSALPPRGCKSRCQPAASVQKAFETQGGKGMRVQKGAVRVAAAVQRRVEQGRHDARREAAHAATVDTVGEARPATQVEQPERRREDEDRPGLRRRR
eukprot:6444077-Prymnesium_polylepis.1